MDNAIVGLIALAVAGWAFFLINLLMSKSMNDFYKSRMTEAQKTRDDYQRRNYVLEDQLKEKNKIIEDVKFAAMGCVNDED